MNARIAQLISTLTAESPGASEDALAELQESLGIKLPDQYLDIMRVSNGAEGFVGENAYLSLYPLEDVIEARKGFLGAGVAPWLLLFGTNGGGAAYAFDTRSEAMPIIEASFPGLDSDPVYTRGATFLDFLEYLASM